MCAAPDGRGPDGQNPQRLEALAVAAAEASAKLIGAQIGRGARVGAKSSPTDVVTQTDLDAESLIRDLLSAATPEAGFLGEEGGATAGGARLQWVCAPLDGTVNFLSALPVVAVSVAAAIDGAVVAGAVVDVVGAETWSAAVG